MARHVSRSGESYVVLHNRLAATYLRLPAREFDLLALMDGSRTVRELVVEYFLRHGVLALQRVVGLVAKLRQHQFLEGAPVEPDAYAALASRLRPSRSAGRRLAHLGRLLLGQEVVIASLDAAIDRWYAAWGRRLFAPPLQFGLAIAAALGPLAFLFALWRGTADSLFAGSALALGLLALLAFSVLVTALHELGHALTLKHVGRHIRRGGFRFYYGLPTLFVDTTDVWMAGPRARLAVSWAGPYTALVLGGLASFGALAAPPGSVVAGEMLLALALVCYLDVLFNLNPLLELDGYYLLVDLLEKPLLRRDALRFAGGGLWRKLARREPLSAEEQLLALFGLACGVWPLLVGGLVLLLWETRLADAVSGASRADAPWWRLALVSLTAVALLAHMGGAARTLWPWLATHSSMVARRQRAVRRRETVELLMNLAFLQDAPREWLVELAALFRPASVLAGTDVVRQGEPGDSFYLVRRGWLEVRRDGQMVAEIGPGSYFGEVALLERGPRTATVTAATECELLHMRGDRFRELLAHEVETARRLRAGVLERAELAQLPLFAGLGSTELDLLFTKLEGRAYSPGETIVRQGEQGDRFYVIRSGRVEIISDGQVVATLGRGEYFGEIALLLDVPRTADVRAVGPEPVATWSLRRQDFSDVLARYLGLGPSLARVSEARLQHLAGRRI